MQENTDQLRRAEAFLRTHPHVQITYQAVPEFAFGAIWYDHGERHDLEEPKMEQLLDKLEGPDGPAPAAGH